MQALRTFLFAYSAYYEALSLDQLCEMFALEKKVVNTLVSKMIISEELFASWDQPTGSIVMHKKERSRSGLLNVPLATRVTCVAVADRVRSAGLHVAARSLALPLPPLLPAPSPLPLNLHLYPAGCITWRSTTRTTSPSSSSPTRRRGTCDSVDMISSSTKGGVAAGVAAVDVEADVAAARAGVGVIGEMQIAVGVAAGVAMKDARARAFACVRERVVCGFGACGRTR